MSTPTVRAMPGTVPRTGMPAPGGYVYRGLGYDQHDPGRSLAGQRRRKHPARTGRSVGPDGRCTACGYLATAPGHRAACGGAA